MLSRAPAQLRHSTQQPDVAYTLADDVVAAHGDDADGDAALSHEGGPLSIARPGEAPTGATVGPVYRKDGGGLAVPTGRALVRFAEGDCAERHHDELAAAGFELEQPLSYAPQAAWVRASSGQITDTLSGLPALERLPGVENVEPQMISEAARRDG